ncbi:lmo0937 family membrane protein [Alkalibaculum sp. M08DMB]|uniref:Lmo0937 family membrane protein n=1 Tax=Alkalibaculum sporogenes TaxID=2655001 RepID=A0A6A7K8P6_9FIRM|nr:lmo0937 family membrane protein [Alkalibaculum sporogenes]MPW25772.1 lmo0937 family membrane protein [Alkalibaculum sporogenes]
MTILKWIGAVVVFFWLLGLVFRIGGGLINLLLIVAAIVFIVDWISGKNKSKGTD